MSALSVAGPGESQQPRAPEGSPTLLAEDHMLEPWPVASRAVRYRELDERPESQAWKLGAPVRAESIPREGQTPTANTSSAKSFSVEALPLFTLTPLSLPPTLPMFYRLHGSVCIVASVSSHQHCQVTLT